MLMKRMYSFVCCHLYSVYHKATQDNETFTTIETRLTYARLMNLKPNSQHIIYVVAIGEKGESLPSETLVAFTDPALPAFVDVSVCVGAHDNEPINSIRSNLCAHDCMCVSF